MKVYWGVVEILPFKLWKLHKIMEAFTYIWELLNWMLE